MLRKTARKFYEKWQRNKVRKSNYIDFLEYKRQRNEDRLVNNYKN